MFQGFDLFRILRLFIGACLSQIFIKFSFQTIHISFTLAHWLRFNASSDLMSSRNARLFRFLKSRNPIIRGIAFKDGNFRTPYRLNNDH